MGSLAKHRRFLGGDDKAIGIDKIASIRVYGRRCYLDSELVFIVRFKRMLLEGASK